MCVFVIAGSHKQNIYILISSCGVQLKVLLLLYHMKIQSYFLNLKRFFFYILNIY